MERLAARAAGKWHPEAAPIAGCLQWVLRCLATRAQCWKRRICLEDRPEEMPLFQSLSKAGIRLQIFNSISVQCRAHPSAPTATMKTGLFLLALICAAAYTAKADVPPREY